MRQPRTLIGIAAAIAVLVTGCAHEARGGHGGAARAPESSTSEVPDYVSYAAGSELAGVTHVGLATAFPADPDWLTIAGNGSVIVDMADEGCSLLLTHGSGADLAVEFTGDDAADTVSTLVAYLGTATVETVPLLWRGTDAETAVDALAFVVENAEGERLLGVARAFGSLDSYVYAELSCAVGVSTETVFAERVALYVSVSLD